MIILNEANRLKQHLADKFGVELPKGGEFHPKYDNISDEDYYKMVDAENRTNWGVSMLTHPNRPNQHGIAKKYADRHNLPIAHATDKSTLHNRINMRAKGYKEYHLKSSVGQRDQMKKEYGDKLTHKYEKQPTPTPEVETPKTANNKSFMSRHGGKVALGIGATAAAAYGIHKYRQNKKKKEEARRQAEAEAKKKTGIKRFLK